MVAHAVISTFGRERWRPGVSGVQDHPQVHRQFKASVNCMRHCLIPIPIKVCGKVCIAFMQIVPIAYKLLNHTHI